VPLAIASGAKREEIDLVLRTHGLRHAFEVIVAAGETPRSKPAPDPYVRAVERLREVGALPEGGDGTSRCVAIEDSRWGLVSARHAGLRCVGITTSYTAAELDVADLVVDRLEEVTLERLNELVSAS
jgi:beta-phosphoglucomutase-like phosphatase (HAD superfamily)